MSRALLISVRLHDGRYHGLGEELPAPARLFQALVAGAGLSGPLSNDVIAALEWLERLDPPLIAAPRMWGGQSLANYVPNNDLDTVGGDPRRIGSVKTSKVVKPKLFDAAIPILFAWSFTADGNSDAESAMICDLADRVYQFGRGVDFAWAWGEILAQEAFESQLIDYPGSVYRPTRNGAGTTVACPEAGSWRSLKERHERGGRRFLAVGKVKTPRYQFTQAPKPRFAQIAYDGSPSRFVLELRRQDDTGFVPWPLERSSALVVIIRDGAVEKLQNALRDRIPEINRALIGRKSNGENAGPSSARVRIIPLASIGHPQADMQIRRILVEVPGECPIRAADVAWAISGLRLDHPVLGDPIDVTPSDDRAHLDFFGIDKPARIWRSVTPVALSEAVRRRIDPNRAKSDDQGTKPGHEKCAEHFRASFAIAQALRHAGIAAKVSSVRLQREPFDQRNMRVEPFAEATRFSKHCLWHAEIEFETLVGGPLLIGDGRFLGLGLMRPITRAAGAFALSVESGLRPNPDPIGVAKALRLAVMSRTRDVLGSLRIPSYFSGHPEDGSSVRSEEPHLAFAFDAVEQQLLVITPGLLDRRDYRCDSEHALTLACVLQELHELRAGKNGYLKLRLSSIDFANHRLFRASRVWESLTHYDVNRHARKSSAERILKQDVTNECDRRGLPRPKVTVFEWKAVSGIGLQGRLRLEFKDAVPGLIVLGRSRHIGGGLFAPG
jgi:CRISPR-associated protein Csb2